jgi:hypothetical protein
VLQGAGLSPTQPTALGLAAGQVDVIDAAVVGAHGCVLEQDGMRLILADYQSLFFS